MRKLIFIDPNFMMGSPAMKGIVRATPDLLQVGVEVEVWCWNHVNIEGVDFKILPQIPVPGFLMGWAFFVVAHLYWISWKLRGEGSPNDLLISTGFYLLPADVALIHFSTFDWMKAQFRIGFHSIRDWLELGYSILCRIPAEILLLWNPWPTRMLAVSRSVGEDMKQWGAPWKKHGILPNPYDSERFNASVREMHREAVRRELGFRPESTIFVFASAGHYQRKGFWLAVEAIARLRQINPETHLLVIGGSPAALKRLQEKASYDYGDWSNWLHFTGMTTEMTRYLAAGDALLFPSHSEAFALVEIEAAAMGLRLYLTPHHGSEMILNEPENGRLIPWDASGIAGILSDEIKADLVRPDDSSHGEAPEQTIFHIELLKHLALCES